MQNIARLGIMAFLFSIPWENMAMIEGFGTVSRLMGMVAFALGCIAFLLQPQFRNLKPFHILFLAFVMYSATSYMWSLDKTLSIERINSNLQLVLFLWLLWHFIETERHVLFSAQAYTLGALLAAIATVSAWLSGVQVVYMRYSAEGFDPNELSIILALAIPIAWYLSMRYSSALLVWMNRISIPILLIAILLTGSRTGVVVAAVGSLFILSTLLQGTTGTKVTAAILVIAGVVALPQVIPESTWERLATLEQEITSGTLNHRTTIWKAGLDIWLGNPAIGVGAGAFRTATQAFHGFTAAPHNSFLSILVELGAIGFLLFTGLILTISRQIKELPTLEKQYYFTVSLILALGLFTLTWETKKPVWLLCSLILCHAFILSGKGEEKNEEIPEESNGIGQEPRLLQSKQLLISPRARKKA